MGQEELEVEIDPTGKVTVRTRGVKGEACVDLVKVFAQLLGREESLQLTHEYYENEVEVRSNLQQKLRR